MDAAAELGRNPVSKHQIQPEYGEMSRLLRDGTVEPVSRDQILRHARGQGNIIFPCLADHEQDWQPYPVDPYPAICDDHTYIHTYILFVLLIRTGTGEYYFPCSADHEQGWQPDPVDPYSAICDDHAYIPYNTNNTVIHYHLPSTG